MSQTLAALAELLIPHYVSASIFAIANKLPEATFQNNVKLLAVCGTPFSFDSFLVFSPPCMMSPLFPC